MKKVFRLILLVLLTITMITPTLTYAADTAEGTQEKQQLRVHTSNLKVTYGVTQGSDIISALPHIMIVYPTGGEAAGTFTYPNYDNNRLGKWDLEWVFTPEDPQYDIASGVIHLEVFAPTSSLSDEVTAPSLTASAVLLDTATAYDINLNDKVSGSSYLWTSSDPGVAEVNSKSGLLKAKSEGKSTVTCEITLPDQSKQTLISEVTVGYDENAPLLTETQLDLNPGDAFDINLENKIAKSKYRWVSSDRSIITVNSANGVITAKAAGTAYVTCTITTPDKQVIVLRCDISVTVPETITE